MNKRTVYRLRVLMLHGPLLARINGLPITSAAQLARVVGSDYSVVFRRLQALRQADLLGEQDGRWVSRAAPFLREVAMGFEVEPESASDPENERTVAG